MDIVDVIFWSVIVLTCLCIFYEIFLMLSSTGLKEKDELKEKDVVIGGKYYISNSQPRNPFATNLFIVCEVVDMRKNFFGEMWVKYQFKDGSGAECSINSFINQFSKYEN